MLFLIAAMRSRAIGSETIPPTPEAGAYLPIIRQDPTETFTPTPTPTRTPTPTSTPRPALSDGDYVAHLSTISEIHFRVTDSGTTASSADFFFLRNLPGCPIAAYTFDGLQSIVDGRFDFAAYDTGFLARMSCGAESTTSASCTVLMNVHDNWLGACGYASGIANRQ
jgi:hypothetical protein